jgi:thioredoxin reductase
MNRQFDIIIVGDSKAGNDAIKYIASSNKSINIAFISRDFKNTTTRDFLNVEYIKGEVKFTDYNNRLFCCYLSNGDRHFCTHLIIASGQSYAPLITENNSKINVFNTTNEIPKASKQQVAVVVGDTDTDVKLALAVAKKFRYVYLCVKTTQLAITPNTRKKLESTDNLLVLHNASIAKVNYDEGVLVSVDLSNYTTITCNAIFAKTKATPETAFVSEKLITKNQDGYLTTTDISQSLLVPKCFAVGSCASKSTKKMQSAMIEAIANDF